MRNILMVFMLLFCIGCETLYTGQGYVVHNDTEAMKFGWVSFDQKVYDNAQKMANVALSINPTNPDAYNLLGLIEIRHDSLDKSITLFEQANDIAKEEDAAILNNLGFAYFKNKEYDRAVETFEKALKKLPANRVSQRGIAISLFKAGKNNEAQDIILTLKSRPDFVSATKGQLEYFNINDAELNAFLDIKE